MQPTFGYESPLNGLKQFAWDSTSLGTFMECPRKWQYLMLDQIASSSTYGTENLFFGSAYHKALELYDIARAAGSSHDEATIHMVKSALEITWDKETDTPWRSPNHAKTRETLVRSIVWYVEHFNNNNCKTVILRNGKPAVELTFKMGIGEDFLYCGHIDRLVDINGKVYVTDRKTTTTTLSPSYFARYDPDLQMSGYSMAGKIILNSPVNGVIIDAAQIAVSFTRFDRAFVHRTEKQLSEWLENAKFWMRLQHQMADNGFFPMNDKSCHKFSGCPYRKICGADPRVRDAIIASDYTRKEWNPLEPR